MRLVAVAAKPWVRDENDAARTPPLADLVEARLDLLPRLDVSLWRKQSPVPVLATLRSRREGGAFEGLVEKARRRLLQAVHDGAEWLDAEADVLPHVLEEARRAGAKVLASFHGEGAIPLPRGGVDAWKVARAVSDGPSVVAALAESRALAAGFLAGENPPAFVVPTGPLGRGLRVVTAAIAEGAGIDSFVYGAFDSSEARDPGPGALTFLPSLPELLDDLRLGEVSGDARLYGLVGRPPTRSPSPRLHNAAFRALGRDAVYLPAADLDARAALALPYDGWSVTTPLKEDVARLVDDLDEWARETGAVNTVVRGGDGRLAGSNTDAEALAAVLSRGARVGSTALVVGGGGYARAAVVVLKRLGLAVRVAGLPVDERAAAALDAGWAGWPPVARPTDAVVVNATPLGAFGDLDGEEGDVLKRLLDSAPASATVVDAPYASGGAPGGFAREARVRGFGVHDGGSLLVAQAAIQARRFSPDRDPAPDVLAFALKARENLVLVGPRGAGKTSVARIVAARLGRPFVDTDDAIARRFGRPTGRVLAEAGEPAFRAAEAREARAALSRRGIVVALGGGALGNEETRRAASRGHVVRLRVSPEQAARRIAADPIDRPRLSDAPDLVEEMRRLIEAREAGYAEVARESIGTDGRSLHDVARDVRDSWTRATLPPDEAP